MVLDQVPKKKKKLTIEFTIGAELSSLCHGSGRWNSIIKLQNQRHMQETERNSSNNK